MDWQRNCFVCCARAWTFGLLPLLVMSFGCAPQPDPAAKQTIKPDRNMPHLLEAEIATIREAIEACGGTIRLDADGQPVAIDLAAERGSADLAGLQAALRCPGLKSLRVRAAGLSERELTEIASLASLEELFFQDVPIGNTFVENTLSGLTSLRRLTLRNTPGVTRLSQIVRLPKLTHLALIDMPIDAGALRPLVDAPLLVSLDVRMCGRLGGEQLEVLADIPKLEQLKLGGYAIDNPSMAAVASIENLKSLTIEDASIDGGGFADLAPVAAQLHSLCLTRCSGMGDDALQTLDSFGNLQTLLLRDLPVTGEFLQSIASPCQLETLALSQTFLGDDAFDAIARCERVKRLDLSKNFLGAVAIEKVSTLAGLEHLNISECGLDASALEPLRNLDNLKTLIVEGNPGISQQAVQGILGTSDAD